MTKSEDRQAIDAELDTLETKGHYGKIEVTAQNGKLIYLRKEWTKPLSGANKKK
jgi:hypothetical protein